MKTKVLLIIFTLSSCFSFSQSKLADKFFKNYAYVKAIELYEEALTKVKDKDELIHILKRLGDCHYNNSRAADAAKYYKRALDSTVANSTPLDIELIYRYIETQRSIGTTASFKEEQFWMSKFKDDAPSDKRINSEVTDISTYEQLKNTSKVYIKIRNLDLNSKYSDFGAYEFDDKLYFASNKDTIGATGKKIYNWNGQPYLDLYETTISENNGTKSYATSTKLSNNDIITDYHESSIAITKDGKTMYLTRDDVNKRNRLSYDKKGTTQLMIYRATLIEDRWVVEPNPLPFNDEKFSTGHPALSPDESKLYFVSDRYIENVSKGQTDIYFVEIKIENDQISYGSPQALHKINTEGREMFPFIANDSTLYFSSDAYVNIGLLDIYKSDVLKGDDTAPKNLGAPINSPDDDFAFFMNSDFKTGYFSSNRRGGIGDDDIYSFLEYECQQTVTGTLRDCEKNEIMANATVELIDAQGVIIETTTTATDGSYTFETVLACNSKYNIRGSKNGFEAAVVTFDTKEEHNTKIIQDLCLRCIKCDCFVIIENIIFDFDKATIYKPDEIYKLENIVDVMRQYPDLKIIIESHTDNRGSNTYNEQLSLCRAKATRDYLIYEREIDPERLPEIYGCGEYCKKNSDAMIDQLVSAKEKNAAHRENRRSVFRIVDCVVSGDQLISCDKCKKGDIKEDRDCKACERFN